MRSRSQSRPSRADAEVGVGHHRLLRAGQLGIDDDVEYREQRLHAGHPVGELGGHAARLQVRAPLGELIAVQAAQDVGQVRGENLRRGGEAIGHRGHVDARSRPGAHDPARGALDQARPSISIESWVPASIWLSSASTACQKLRMSNTSRATA